MRRHDSGRRQHRRTQPHRDHPRSALQQPYHKDAGDEHVYSVIVALNRRRGHVEPCPAPIELGAGDALIFQSWSLCHGGAGLEMGEPRGIGFSPAKGLHLSDDLALNYIVTARAR